MAEINFNQIPEIQKVDYKEYEYQVSYGETKIFFNDASKDYTHLMAVEKGDTLLRFQLPGVAPKETLVTDNTLFYPEVFTNVDASYEVLQDRVKETIIIKDASAIRKFDYSTIEQNINASFKDDGSIVYLDSNENELYTVEAPYAFDANNNEVEVYMTNQISGYTLEVVPTADTVYPIYLDPTVTVGYAYTVHANSYPTTSGTTNTLSTTIDFSKFLPGSVITFKYWNVGTYSTPTCKLYTKANPTVPVSQILSKGSGTTTQFTFNVDTTVYAKMELYSSYPYYQYSSDSFTMNVETVVTPTGANLILGGNKTVNTLLYDQFSAKAYTANSRDEIIIFGPKMNSPYTGAIYTNSTCTTQVTYPFTFVANTTYYINSHTGTTNVLYYNTPAATINVSLTLDCKRSVIKSATSTCDLKRKVAKSNSIVMDSKRPVCVGAHITLDTKRTTVQHVVLINDIKKVVISNITTNLDLKRAVGISQSISIDTIRLATISQYFSSDTYREVQKSTALTLDLNRSIEANENISLDTIRKTSILNTLSLDISRTVTKKCILTLDTLRKSYVGSMWVERTAQKYQDGTLYTSVKSKNLIPDIVPASEYTLDGYGLFGLDLVVGFRDPATNTFWSPFPSEYNLSVTVLVNGVQKSLTAVYTSKYTTVNNYNINFYTLKITSDVPITSVGYIVPNGSTHLTGDTIIYSSKNSNSSTYFKYFYKYGTFIPVTLTLDVNKSVIKTNQLNLDTIKNTLKSTSYTLDLNRSVAVKDNILMDTNRTINKSVQLNVDTIKTVLKSDSISLDTNRTTQANYSTIFDSVRKITIPIVFSLDMIRTVLATNYTTLDSQRQMVASESIVLDTKRSLAVNNSQTLDTIKTVRTELTTVLDTKRCINKINSPLLFLDTKKIVYADTESIVDTDRKIAQTTSATLDTDKQSTIEVHITLDVSRQVIKEQSQSISLDTVREVVTNTSISMDTKKVSTVTSNITLDTIKDTVVTNGIQLDTMKITQSKIGLGLDISRNVCKNAEVVLDTKRSTALPVVQILDSSRTTVVSSHLTLDTKKESYKTVSLNLDAKKKTVVNDSLNLDTLRKTKVGYESSVIFSMLSGTCTSQYTSVTLNYDLLKSVCGFKIKEITFGLSATNNSSSPVATFNGTTFTGTGVYTYTNTNSDDLAVTLKVPTKIATTNATAAITVTKIVTDKEVFVGYNATATQVTIPHDCIINKVTQYSTAKTSILVNNVAKTIPYQVKAGDIVSTSPITGAVLYLQVSAIINVSLKFDLKREIAVNTSTTLDSNRQIGVLSNLTLNTIKEITKNISSSFDTIRISEITVSTNLSTKRLIASEGKIVLDTLREVVNKYEVHSSFDTLRVVQKSVEPKYDILRSVVVNNETKMDVLRTVWQRDQVVLDTNRNTIASTKLNLDTSRKVDAKVITNLDLNRKVTVNINTSLDTLKVIGRNTIYLLDTVRTVNVHPLLNLDINRQVIKSVEEYKDVVRDISANVDISMDTFKEVQSDAGKVILDTSKLIQKDMNIVFDTKRAIFMNSSYLFPTLDINYVYNLGELEYVSSFDSNMLVYEAVPKAEVIDIVATDGSKEFIFTVTQK